MNQNLVDHVDYGLCALQTIVLWEIGLWTRIQWTMWTMDYKLVDYMDYELESSRLCGLWTRNQWTMLTMGYKLVNYVDYGLETSGLYGLWTRNKRTMWTIDQMGWGLVDVPVNKCENNRQEMALIGDFNARVYMRKNRAEPQLVHRGATHFKYLYFSWIYRLCGRIQKQTNVFYFSQKYQNQQISSSSTLVINTFL